uniref:Uncharacterized protein n=1 Tax=Trichogramma kaykai TaxID=54128 RepID=A0ABD2VUX4_9HYME
MDSIWMRVMLAQVKEESRRAPRRVAVSDTPKRASWFKRCCLSFLPERKNLMKSMRRFRQKSLAANPI